MLDEDCDIGKLEGSVEECGVQGFAEWEVCGFHGVYSIADLSGSGDDVRDVDDQQLQKMSAELQLLRIHLL